MKSETLKNDSSQQHHRPSSPDIFESQLVAEGLPQMCLESVAALLSWVWGAMYAHIPWEG